MSIKLTQQYVDVFGHVEGYNYVDMQYVEVLLTDALRVSASSTLNLSQDAFLGQRVSASNDLGIFDVASNWNHVWDRKLADSVLDLTHTAHAFGHETVVSDLVLSDDVDVRGPILLGAESRVTFSDIVRWPDKYVWASNDLDLVSVGNIPVFLTVAHTLGITDYADMLPVTSVIVFVQTAVGGKSPGVQIQLLSLEHTVKNSGTFRRTVLHDLGLTSNLTYLDDSPCGRKSYTPFKGANSEMPDQVKAQYTGSDRFKLYYPSRGARASEVIIRAPRFGNKDINAYNRVSRETRGGALYVYADPIWPKVRTMSVTVSGLTGTEVEDVQAFLYAYLGVQIGITDWEGHEWEGVIVDPGQPAVQDGKEKWTITFNFEGEIIASYSTGSTLAASQETSAAKDPGANSDLGLSHRLAGPIAQDAGRDLAFNQSATATVS